MNVTITFTLGEDAGTTFQLASGDTKTFGRGSQPDIKLRDEVLSRVHCRIRAEGSGCYVRDEGSLNGTTVNGRRITKEVRLSDGDVLGFGTARALVRLEPAEGDWPPESDPAEASAVTPAPQPARKSADDKPDTAVIMAALREQDRAGYGARRADYGARHEAPPRPPPAAKAENAQPTVPTSPAAAPSTLTEWLVALLIAGIVGAAVYRFGEWIWLYVLIAALLAIIAGLWGIFSKAGDPGWKALIPVYNLYILLQIAGKPAWYLPLMLIPAAIGVVILLLHFVGGTLLFLLVMPEMAVSLVALMLVCLALARNFGRGLPVGAGLIVLPWVFLPMLGYDGSEFAQDMARTNRERVMAALVVALLTAGLIALLFLFRVALPGGRETGRIAECGANLTEICRALRDYQAANMGALPADLSDLHPKFLGDARRLVCPSDPNPATIGNGLPCSYRYIGKLSGDDLRELGPNAIILYESSANHPKGRNAASLDGRVRWMAEPDFAQALADQYLLVRKLMAGPAFTGDRAGLKAFHENP